jgi:hypothetical protein
MTEAPFSLQGFAAGPAGDVALGIQWLGPYEIGKCNPSPQVTVYRYDASGAPAGSTQRGANWYEGLSGLAFDPQGDVLFSNGNGVGYCPIWDCGSATIERMQPDLTADLYSRYFGYKAANVPPFTAMLLGGTASGDLFAGLHIIVYPTDPFPSDVISFGGSPLYGDVIVHLGPAGALLDQAPWPAYGVQAVGALGGLYAGYTFQGTTDAGCGPVTGNAASNTLVAKLNAAGQCVWSRPYPVNTRFALGPAEEILLATSFSGTVDFGFGPLTAAGAQDLAIAKLDAAGQLLWQERFGAPGAALSLRDLGADTQGGPVLVADISGAVSFDCDAATAAPGQVNTLFAGFSPAGDNRYARVLHPAGSYQTKVDGLGGVYLVSTDTAFDVGNGPLLSGDGVAVARVAP